MAFEQAARAIEEQLANTQRKTIKAKCAHHSTKNYYICWTRKMENEHSNKCENVCSANRADATFFIYSWNEWNRSKNASRLSINQNRIELKSRSKFWFEEINRFEWRWYLFSVCNAHVALAYRVCSRADHHFVMPRMLFHRRSLFSYVRSENRNTRKYTLSFIFGLRVRVRHRERKRGGDGEKGATKTALVHSRRIKHTNLVVCATYLANGVLIWRIGSSMSHCSAAISSI